MPNPAQSNNQALNTLVDLVTRIDARVRFGYNSITGQNALTASFSSPYNRAANNLAVRTVVTNTGSTTLRVKENGIIVADQILPNGTWESPDSGAGIITVDTAGTSTTFSIATYILDPSLL